MSAMVVPGLRAYEDNVYAFGSRPQLLWRFRQRLVEMRERAPFFNLNALARDQERVARAMYEVYAVGNAPMHIIVAR